MQTQTTAVSFTLHSAAQWSAAWKMFCFYRRFGSFGLWSQCCITGCCRQMTENFEDVDLVTTLCVFLCTSSVLLFFRFIFYMCAFPLQLCSSHHCGDPVLWASSSGFSSLFFFFTRPNYILISVFLCGHLGFKFGCCFCFFSFCNAVRELLILQEL